MTRNRTRFTVLNVSPLLVALLSGCAATVASPDEFDESSSNVEEGSSSSDAESGPEETDATAPERPSGSWYIGHAMSQGVLDDAVASLRLRIETLGEEPVVGSTFCLLSGHALCDDSDTDGVVAFPPATSDLLVASTSPDYAQSLFTISTTDTLDLTDRPLPLLTESDLDEVYDAAGIPRDDALGAVMVELPQASAENVIVTVRDLSGTDMAHTTHLADGTAYLLGVTPGNVVLAFERDGMPCSELGTNGWRTTETNEVSTFVTSGGVSFAGVVDCR